MAGKKKNKKEHKAKKSTRPRQVDLPGMESRMYPDLDEQAHEYAEIRDERMALNERESHLKERLLKMMHSHDLKLYKYEDVEIEIEPGEENVKVRIKKAKADTEEEAA